MAYHKKEIFEMKDQELAAFSKAISHPARIAILKVLAQRQECICGQIVEVLPLAQSTVSQHLKELQKAGLINGTIDGPRSCYCINWEIFNRFSDQFTESFSQLAGMYQEACSVDPGASSKNCC